MADENQNSAEFLAKLEVAYERIINGRGTNEDFALIHESLRRIDAEKDKFKEQTATPELLQDYFNKQIQQYTDNRAVLEDISDIDQEILGLHEDAIDRVKELIEQKITAGELNDQELKDLQTLYKAYARRRREKQNFFKAQEKGAEFTDRMLKATIGLNTEWSGIGAAGFFKGFAKQLKRTVTLSNVLATIAGGVVEQFFKLDQAQADLFKETGLTRQQVNLGAVGMQLKGVATEMNVKAKENVAHLFNANRQFDQLTQTQLRTYADASILMTEMGASGQAVADIFTYNRIVLKKSPEEATNAVLRMRQLSKLTGRSVEETVREFAKSAPTLAMYGNESEKIFKGLSLEAKRLNMEVSELLGLSLGMDSFEGAAKAAQNFNLAFGGPFISAQALMGASVEDKYKMVAEAYKKSGKKLSRREISGLAKDAGLNEQKLMQILNREQGAAVDKKMEQKSTQELMDEQVDVIKKNTSVQTRINAQLEHLYRSIGEKLFANDGLFAIMDVVVDLLTFMVDNFKLMVAAGVGMKTAMAIAGSRGATPANPEFVVPLGGAGTAAGKMGRGFGGLAAGLVVGGLAYAGMSMLEKDPPPSPDTQNMERLQQQQADAEAELNDKAGQATEQNATSVLQTAEEREAKMDAFFNRGPTIPPPPGSMKIEGLKDFSNQGSPGAVSMPSGGGGGSTGGPSVVQTKTNDGTLASARSGTNINIGGSKLNIATTKNVSNSEATYVQPTFHKNDKYYNFVAAKKGGSIITALKTLEDAVDSMVSGIKNTDNKLSIDMKEFIRTVKEGLNEYA